MDRGIRALLTKAVSHSCSVFLLDQNELVAKVFDGGVVDDEVRQGPMVGMCGRGPVGQESVGGLGAG